MDPSRRGQKTQWMISTSISRRLDSVPRKRRKLAAYGITGKILRWIETFLTDRKQRVCVEGSLSNWKDVLSGIPQGSVLGPTLFVVFINDMPDVITSLSKMFADDAKVLRLIETSVDIATLQNDLDHLTDWSIKWQMHFNVNKCKRFHIGQTNPAIYTPLQVLIYLRVIKNVISASQWTINLNSTFRLPTL